MDALSSTNNVSNLTSEELPSQILWVSEIKKTPNGVFTEVRRTADLFENRAKAQEMANRINQWVMIQNKMEASDSEIVTVFEEGNDQFRLLVKEGMHPMIDSAVENERRKKFAVQLFNENDNYIDKNEETRKLATLVDFFNKERFISNEKIELLLEMMSSQNAGLASSLRTVLDKVKLDAEAQIIFRKRSWARDPGYTLQIHSEVYDPQGKLPNAFVITGPMVENLFKKVKQFVQFDRNDKYIDVKEETTKLAALVDFFNKECPLSDDKIELLKNMMSYTSMYQRSTLGKVLDKVKSDTTAQVIFRKRSRPTDKGYTLTFICQANTLGQKLPSAFVITGQMVEDTFKKVDKIESEVK